jgi:hypothetical protein
MAEAVQEGQILVDAPGADGVAAQGSAEAGLGQEPGEKKTKGAQKPVADEFTRATFTATQKLLREQRFAPDCHALSAAPRDVGSGWAPSLPLVFGRRHGTMQSLHPSSHPNFTSCLQSIGADSWLAPRGAGF